MNLSSQEELLIKRCLKRDAEAFQEVLDLYGGSVYGFLFTVLGGDADSAQRLCKKVICQTLKDPYLHENSESLNAALIRKALNELKQENLEMGFSEGLHALEFPESMQLAMDAGTSLRVKFIFQGLQALDGQDRILILLRDQLFFTYPEIGDLLHLHEPQLRDRLHHARLALRDAMDKTMGNHS